MIRILETKERVIADNDAVAKKTREDLNEKKVFFMNLMGSPGCGKTSLLVNIIPYLKKRYSVAVMEADVDSDVDAKTIQDLGVKTVQLHSGGLCHMDADMTARGLEYLGLEDVDVVIMENIGNLVCPAEFDTGAHLKVMILSVPEGDDKPLKYPLMFQTVDMVVVSKKDVCEVFDFDSKRFEKNLRTRNPDTPVFYLSNTDKEGVGEFVGRLIEKIEEFRKS